MSILILKHISRMHFVQSLLLKLNMGIHNIIMKIYVAVTVKNVLPELLYSYFEYNSQQFLYLK